MKPDLTKKKSSYYYGYVIITSSPVFFVGDIAHYVVILSGYSKIYYLTNNNQFVRFPTYGRRGKGKAVSLLAKKNKASTAEGRWMRNLVWPSSCVTPAGTSTSLRSRINGKKAQHKTRCI